MAAFPEASAWAGEHIDLIGAPFTIPRSRLLVLRRPDGDGLRICASEYERRLDDCVVVERLQATDAEGRDLEVRRVLPHRIDLGDDTVVVTFDGPATIVLGGVEGSSVRLTLPGGRDIHHRFVGDGDSLRLEVAPDRSVASSITHDITSSLVRTAQLWDEWFARCPRVRADLQPMAAFCWWVLGANIVELPALGDARVVVPSKIGYVGLWQWDAYFIAVGLRHGHIELAREQLELALRFPTAAGQLPDVVHEEGVLASSDDLPPADRENLRRAGSAVADPGAPVPLTKPPLAAWALRKLLEIDPAPQWARAMVPTVLRSQEWWFAAADLDGDGMPEYGHPYSSGLDDSPIFDGPLPTTSPDLGAYLVLQDLELASLPVELLGDESQVGALRARASRTLELLLSMWDDERGHFVARAAGEPVPSHTIVSLMPLVTGTLPPHIAQVMVASLTDPNAFGTPWPAPTVAVSDVDFSPERMWRGPVWINTNALLVEGLGASGYVAEARELAERTVALVVHGGGPHEYFNPFTGEKAATATTSFGWSAALFLDLAVGLSQDAGGYADM